MQIPNTPLAANAPSSREKLKEAHGAVALATATVHQAQEVSDRANAALATATATRNDSLKLERGVLDWKTDQLRTGSTERMPEHLIEARRDGMFAAEQLQHAEAIAGQMSTELDLAKSTLKRKEDERAIAVSDVALEHARTLLAKVKEHQEQRQHLRDILRGLGEANVFHGLKTRDFLGEALYDPIVPMLAFPPTLPVATLYWKDFAAALVADPDSMPKDIPAKDEIFIG